jgi:hypothetical protein
LGCRILELTEDLGCRVLELAEDLGCRILELADEDLGCRVLELAEDLFFLDCRESIEQYGYYIDRQHELISNIVY